VQDREGRIPRIGSPNITPSCCRTRRTGGPPAIAAKFNGTRSAPTPIPVGLRDNQAPGEAYNAISRRNLAELRWSRTDAATIVSPDRITFYRGPCSAGSAQVVSCCGIAPSAPPRCSGATLNFRRALNLLTRSRDQRADFPDGEPTLSGGCCERSPSRPEAPTCGQPDVQCPNMKVRAVSGVTAQCKAFAYTTALTGGRTTIFSRDFLKRIAGAVSVETGLGDFRQLRRPAPVSSTCAL
jgi:hypothetical protein